MLYRWLLLVVSVAGLQAQNSVLSCAPSAVPTNVRAEGIAERTGDILLSCSGGQPGTQVSGNVVVSVNVNVTNRILGDGTTDVFLTVNNGLTTTTYNARPYQTGAVAFNGVLFNASPQGTADLRIVNLRGNVSQLGFANNTSSILAQVSFTGAGLAVLNSQFVVAVPQRALLAATLGQLVCDQNGSPLPATLDFASLLSTSASSTTRVTEGFASAFAPLSDPSNLNADSGVRILARYSGFSSYARLFVPNAIAGSDADVPTAVGNLGFAASGGQYSPGKSQLLLIRVVGADANGAGGLLAIPVPGSQTSFNSVGEIGLASGSGYAVFEVVDGNPFARESAQFPTFLGLAPNSGASGTPTGFSVSLAPVSTVFIQSQTAPIPRFLETAPPSDCTALGDCSAGYLPQFQVDSTPLQFVAVSGQSATQYLPIHNVGAGTLRWTAQAVYPPGTASNFLVLSPTQGVNNGTLRIDAVTRGLTPGTYQATIQLDAGPLASNPAIPVTLTVTSAGPVPVPSPSITSIKNAADADQSTLVAGSLATVMGASLGGRTVSVTFDGTPANLLYLSNQQINLQVPAALGGKPSARVVVSVDGNISTASTVNLANAAPGIFPGGVLNQDWNVNSGTATARVGSVVQVFATGLPSSGVITAKIHDRVVSVPQYGGPAPGFPGVQQVNLYIPSDLPTMQTYVFVCGGATADQQVCSAPAKIWITQ
jgi:uncharacterized protein (TIGR03437 family)